MGDPGGFSFIISLLLLLLLLFILRGFGLFSGDNSMFVFVLFIMEFDVLPLRRAKLLFGVQFM